MLNIRNIDALVLFDYLKTEEGKDVAESIVYGKSPNITHHCDPSQWAFNIDSACKKVSTTLPSKNVLKQLAIDKFILEKKQYFNLSWEETQNVWNNIMIGIILKTFNSKDFVWNNGKIESISGLNFLDVARITNDARFV